MVTEREMMVINMIKAKFIDSESVFPREKSII